MFYTNRSTLSTRIDGIVKLGSSSSPRFKFRTKELENFFLKGTTPSIIITPSGLVPRQQDLSSSSPHGSGEFDPLVDEGTQEMDAVYPEPMSRLHRRTVRKPVHRGPAGRYRTQPVTFSEIKKETHFTFLLPKKNHGKPSFKVTSS
uniref:Uncharacterized protein n=1 Tax=Timema bartmani TaxID=61472 RepID=A0A7R9EQW4_9NEOP|nr:unnamed protein product [Timema bartmani]